MEIPGLYIPDSRLEVTTFFKPRAAQIPVEAPAEWQNWNGAQCAWFIAEECKLPEYVDVAERNLTGAYLKELLQAGLLSKGLARTGIGDFEHVRQITAAVQKLDMNARFGMSSPVVGSLVKPTWKVPSSPPKMGIPRSSMSLPKLKGDKPKLLQQVHSGYDASWPEYQRRQFLASSLSKVKLPQLKKAPRAPNACPVEVKLRNVPVNYIFDGRHSPTVVYLRESASEGSLRTAYSMLGRASPEPFGGQSGGAQRLVKTDVELGGLPNDPFDQHLGDAAARVRQCEVQLEAQEAELKRIAAANGQQLH
jgi:hypothetical protein